MTWPNPADAPPRKLPWMAFFHGDFFGSARVRVMPPEAQLAYLRLLGVQWDHGSIPDDAAQARRLAPEAAEGITDETWPALRALFAAGDDGHLRNPKCAAERKRAIKALLQRIEASAAGVAARQRKARQRPDSGHSQPAGQPSGQPAGQPYEQHPHKGGSASALRCPPTHARADDHERMDPARTAAGPGSGSGGAEPAPPARARCPNCGAEGAVTTHPDAVTARCRVHGDVTEQALVRTCGVCAARSRPENVRRVPCPTCNSGMEGGGSGALRRPLGSVRGPGARLDAHGGLQRRGGRWDGHHAAADPDPAR